MSSAVSCFNPCLVDEPLPTQGSLRRSPVTRALSRAQLRNRLLSIMSTPVLLAAPAGAYLSTRSRIRLLALWTGVSRPQVSFRHPVGDTGQLNAEQPPDLGDGGAEDGPRSMPVSCPRVHRPNLGATVG